MKCRQKKCILYSNEYEYPFSLYMAKYTIGTNSFTIFENVQLEQVVSLSVEILIFSIFDLYMQ